MIVIVVSDQRKYQTITVVRDDRIETSAQIMDRTPDDIQIAILEGVERALMGLSA